MGRRARVNPVPVAPFSVAGLQYPANQFKVLLARLGGQMPFTGAPGAYDARATIDAGKCSECGSTVRWERAYHPTDTYTWEGKTKAHSMIFARCATHGRSDTWGQPQATHTPPAEPKPAEPTKETPMPGSLDAIVDERISTVVGDRLATLEAKSGLTPDEIAKIARDAVESARRVHITVEGMPEVKFEGTAHPLLARILRYIAAGTRYFYIWGKAGGGKSTVGIQLGEALKRPVTVTAMSEMSPVETISGYENALKSEYVPSAIVKAWTSGAVIVVDEADAQNANTALAWNGIEQGILYTPDGPKARHPDTVLVCTANTAGGGASRSYNGRNQLDGAFMDRFRVLHCEYNEALEVKIAGGDDVAAKAVALAVKARKECERNGSQRMLTSRLVRRAAEDMRLDGCTAGEAFKLQARDMGWEPHEMSMFD